MFDAKKSRHLGGRYKYSDIVLDVQKHGTLFNYKSLVRVGAFRLFVQPMCPLSVSTKKKQIEICRISKQSRRPLSVGKCRFLVLGMGTQFYVLLLIIYTVATIVLLMVIFLSGDEGTTRFGALLQNYCE